MVNKCVKEFLGKILVLKTIVNTVPKKDMEIALSYLDKLPFQICKKINGIMKNKLLHCNIWFIFQTKCQISNFLHLKTIPSFLCSDTVYKFQHSGCNATYYGKTEHHVKVRMCEHLGISALTGRRIKGDDDSAIKEQLFLCNDMPDFKDFLILIVNNANLKATLLESILINRDQPLLNKNKESKDYTRLLFLLQLLNDET